MNFDSPQWLFTMAVVPLIFWLCAPKYRFDMLSVLSVVVLLIWDWRSAVLLSGLACITGFVIRRRTVSGNGAIVVVLCFIGLLVLFKLATNMTFFSEQGLAILPLGISYYTLRCAHLVIERYKGGVAELSWRALLHYLFFVPTFVIGPIHRYADFARDVRRHRWNDGDILDGVWRIIVGYVKVLLIGVFAVGVFEHQALLLVGADNAGGTTYIRMVVIGINLYFFFAGYSDISIGFARLLGIRVMENFNNPYIAPNISNFWQRWHISLTSWSRDYVYTSGIALTRSPAFGAFVSLIFIALWHEPTWQYFLWGVYHGSAIFIWQRFQGWKRYMPAIRSQLVLRCINLFSVLVTIHYVWLGFLLVREDTLSGMIDRVLSLLGG